MRAQILADAKMFDIGKYVFKISLLQYIILSAGIYPNYTFPFAIRLFGRIYCAVYFYALVYSTYLFFNTFHITFYIDFCHLICLLSFFCYTAQRQFFDYFTVNKVYDDLSYYTRLYKKIEILIFLKSFIFNSGRIFYFFITLIQRKSVLIGTHVIHSLTDYSILMGCLPMNAFCMLLLIRVKILREKVERHGFGEIPANEKRSKNIIVYETILENWKKNSSFVMVSILLNLINTVLKTLLVVVQFASDMKYGSDDPHKNLILGGRLVQAATTFYPCIIMEIINDDLEEIKIYSLNQLLTNTDEAQKADIREFLHFLKDRPLTLTIFGMLPINMQLVVKMFFFLSSYVVVVFQFTLF